jgi:hypothetical protein
VNKNIWLLFALTISHWTQSAYSQTVPCGENLKTQTPKTDNLIGIAVVLEHTFACPMIVEIAQPAPIGLQLLAGSRTLRQELDEIVRQAPNYRWREVGGVFLLGEFHLESSSGNPMNKALDTFVIPPTLDMLKVSLPNIIEAGGSRKGLILNGFGVGLEGDAQLIPATLLNVTGRKALIRIFQDLGRGFSMIIFRCNEPNNRHRDAMGDWTLVAGQALTSFDVQQRSIPESNCAVSRHSKR